MFRQTALTFSISYAFYIWDFELWAPPPDPKSQNQDSWYTLLLWLFLTAYVQMNNFAVILFIYHFVMFIIRMYDFLLYNVHIF